MWYDDKLTRDSLKFFWKKINYFEKNNFKKKLKKLKNSMAWHVSCKKNDFFKKEI